MSDGTIRTYWDEPQQPKPVIFKTLPKDKPVTKMDVMDEWTAWDEYPWYIRQERHKHLYFMGKYIPKHNKKTGGAATPTGR